jgi:chitinase
MTQISNLRISFGGETFATLYDLPRNVTLASAPTGNGNGNGNGGTCSAAAWVATSVYTGGQTVSHGGKEYTAKWWTQGDTPGTNAVWDETRTCR